MIIKTSDIKTIKSLAKGFFIPRPNSHKGQNGKILIIGGSSLFHAASIWSAEITSHFADIVHYTSTKENKQVFLSLKKKFINGIIIPQKELIHYIKEDDAILAGPGMLRKNPKLKAQMSNQVQNPKIKFRNIIEMKDEGEYTYRLTKYLIENFPEKKFVFDAGSLQMMESDWLKKLKTPAIITPHQIEFENLFSTSIRKKSVEQKEKIIRATAKKYHCIVLLKAIVDIISDGNTTYVIEGGNQGLTKGGTGDLLAGLSVSFYCKNEPLMSAVLASYLLKKSAEFLCHSFGYWYNIDNLIKTIPQVFKNLIFGEKKNL